VTEFAFARYFCALIVVLGLVLVGIAFADRPWLVGIVLIIVGGVIGAPLWKWHLDAEAEAREMAKLRPESARQQPVQQPEV